MIRDGLRSWHMSYDDSLTYFFFIYSFILDLIIFLRRQSQGAGDGSLTRMTMVSQIDQTPQAHKTDAGPPE